MERKVALFIGASSGIGESMAGKLPGYSVYNISRTPCLVEGVTNLLGDVAQEEDRERTLALFAEKESSLDLFVYAAGESMSAPVEYATGADMRRLFEVNFFGFAETLRKVLPKLKAARGQVIVLSSLASVLPIPFDAFYDASKSAVNGFVRALCMELAPYCVNVAGAVLGGTQTGFTFKRNIYQDEKAREYTAECLSAAGTLSMIEQRGGEVEQTAEAVLGLMGKNGCYVLGWKNVLAAFVAKWLPEKTLISLTRAIFCR